MDSLMFLIKKIDESKIENIFKVYLIVKIQNLNYLFKNAMNFITANIPQI